MSDQSQATGTSARHPLVEAAAFTAMTVDQIADVLKASGFSIEALGDRHISGARPVPGHPATTSRTAHFTRIFGFPPVAWTGNVNLRFPHPNAGELCGSKLNAPGARFPTYTSRLLHQVRWVRTIDELEAWLGGVCSVPIDDAEIVAIASSCVCKGRGHDEWGNICACRMGTR